MKIETITMPGLVAGNAFHVIAFTKEEIADMSMIIFLVTTQAIVSRRLRCYRALIVAPFVM